MWISLCIKVEKIWGTKLTLSVIFNFQLLVLFQGSSQVALLVRNLPANAGDVKDAGSIPGLERSSAGGHGNTLQYSCLENLMDRGAWWATGHGVAKSQTQHQTAPAHRIQKNKNKKLLCPSPDGGVRPWATTSHTT